MPHSPAAIPSASERREPSLSEPPHASPRLVASDAPRSPRAALRAASPLPELRAGERIDVASSLTSPSRDNGAMLKKAAFALLVVLALVGAASILHGFAGL
jgi:hypothetical protein